MARYALIDDKTELVANVIELEPDAVWAPPAGCSIVESDTAGRGDTYKGGKFTQPKFVEPAADPRKAEWAAASDSEKLDIIGKRLRLVD